VEVEWLKKSPGFFTPGKRGLIDMNNRIIPITRQCELLSLNRASFYYRLHPVSDFNFHLMMLIDQLYTKDLSLYSDQSFSHSHEQMRGRLI
jgi:putative transposase